ncbi:type III-B CRISPR module RAMP protein Cmr1 [Methylotuvimicrobium sp. KM2]|uniref:type III-B CRISPR module RAMP protein Cmr1 n=1 Tax=Methylotuvimicrobium sp. KM2 TaxID=3133976 RepID=UPI003100AD5B
MQILEAKYEIVTPIFIGGADANDKPELRPPSIKGALRFWWRALHWGRYLREQDNDDIAALNVLHEKEAELFGAATRENRYGQGLFQLKLTDVKTQGIEKSWPKNNEGGAGFLGYGLDATQSGDPHRKGIANGTFTLQLGFKKTANEEHIQQLEDTLIIWGMLGGLGSRARRGFGSVAMTSLNGHSYRFDTTAAYFDAISQRLNAFDPAPSMPIYTAFSQTSRIVDAGQGRDVKLLMNRLGDRYREARKRAGRGLNKLPFGLPLAGNYGEADEDNRRAGSLLMHLHPVGNEYVSVITWLPAIFHPGYPSGNQLDFYCPVQAFIDSMEQVYP